MLFFPFQEKGFISHFRYISDIRKSYDNGDIALFFYFDVRQLTHCVQYIGVSFGVKNKRGRIFHLLLLFLIKINIFLVAYYQSSLLCCLLLILIIFNYQNRSNSISGKWSIPTIAIYCSIFSNNGCPILCNTWSTKPTFFLIS